MTYSAKIIQVFETNQNTDQALKMAHYMQNKFVFYGIPSSLRKDLQKPFLEKKNLPQLNNLEEVIWSLWSEEARECQYFAIDLLKKYMNQLDKSYIDLYEKIIIHKSWWDTVDLLASTLVGKLVAKYPELIEEKVDYWIASDNIWLQRTAILFQLKYKENTDFDLLQKYIRHRAKSEGFFIQKAIGWALRQYSKFNPEQVKIFIKNTALAKLSKKEGSKYIE